MNETKAHKYHVEISFRGLLGQIVLGVVTVYARNEDEALDMAESHVNYRIMGDRGHTFSQVREQAVSYGKI